MTEITPTSSESKARGSEITPEHPVVVLGGGPAGLTAGYLLASRASP